MPSNPEAKALLAPEQWGWLKARLPATERNPIKAAEHAITCYAECFPEAIGLAYWGDCPEGYDPMGSPILLELANNSYTPRPEQWVEAGWPADTAEHIQEDPVETTMNLRQALFNDLGWPL